MKTQAKDQRKLLLLIYSSLCLYLAYLINYRWQGRMPDTFVHSFFIQSNLMFSIWFVLFLVMAFRVLHWTLEAFEVLGAIDKWYQKD